MPNARPAFLPRRSGELTLLMGRGWPAPNQGEESVGAFLSKTRTAPRKVPGAVSSLPTRLGRQLRENSPQRHKEHQEEIATFLLFISLSLCPLCLCGEGLSGCRCASKGRGGRAAEATNDRREQAVKDVDHVGDRGGQVRDGGGHVGE